MSDLTRVVFRVWREKGGDVFALFPGLPTDYLGRFCSCYEHTGQHSSADYGHCIRLSRPATHEEARDLAHELTGRGYKLQAIQRRTKRDRDDYAAAFRELGRKGAEA